MPLLLRVSFLSVFLLLAVSCSSDDSSLDESVDERPTAEQLYINAQGLMAEKDYPAAVEEFQEIERQYPFSPLATRAQVMAAYAHYKDQEYDDALVVLERFIKLHPGNTNISYTYYLRALCFYERIADIKRDQEMTKKALEALNDVVVRFPDTDYYRDAKLKLDLAKDHLAGKEMEIARFYQKRRQFIAAINRFKTVVKEHDTTSHVPEALYRLTEIYLTLGVEEEARRNAAVLGHNFSDSKWYKYAYRLTVGGKTSPKPKEESMWIPDWFGGEENEELTSPPVPRDGEKGWFYGMLDIFE